MRKPKQRGHSIGATQEKIDTSGRTTTSRTSEKRLEDEGTMAKKRAMAVLLTAVAEAEDAIPFVGDEILVAREGECRRLFLVEEATQRRPARKRFVGDSTDLVAIEVALAVSMD